MLEAGANVSILHTRTQQTLISDLPQTAETSAYRRKERNDTADQKSFTGAGQGLGHFQEVPTIPHYWNSRKEKPFHSSKNPKDYKI